MGGIEQTGFKSNWFKDDIVYYKITDPRGNIKKLDLAVSSGFFSSLQSLWGATKAITITAYGKERTVYAKTKNIDSAIAFMGGDSEDVRISDAYNEVLKKEKQESKKKPTLQRMAVLVQEHLNPNQKKETEAERDWNYSMRTIDPNKLKKQSKGTRFSEESIQQGKSRENVEPAPVSEGAGANPQVPKAGLHSEFSYDVRGQRMRFTEIKKAQLYSRSPFINENSMSLALDGNGLKLRFGDAPAIEERAPETSQRVHYKKPKQVQLGQDTVIGVSTESLATFLIRLSQLSDEARKDLSDKEHILRMDQTVVSQKHLLDLTAYLNQFKGLKTMSFRELYEGLRTGKLENVPKYLKLPPYEDVFK